MRKSESNRKAGGKSVKFDKDTPSTTKTKVDETKRKDGIKRISFTQK